MVVPVRDGGEAFVRCLDGLAACRPAPAEIVVVTDGRDDGSAAAAEARGARVLRSGDPGGPARARNAGARAAAADVILFVDADVAVPPDIIGRVAEAFRDPSLDALIGSYDDAPAARGFFAQYKNLMHHWVHQTAREEAGTFWGACGAIRRDVFLASGGFDESYRRPSIEDIELGVRLRRAGHRIRLRRDIRVKHLKRWTFRSMVSSDVRDRALPWTRLIVREGRLPDDLNLRWGARASGVLALAFPALLAAGIVRRPLLAGAGGAAAALLALNFPLYRFLRRRRGWWFALRAIPLHWLYFFYSALAFATAAAGTRIGRRAPRGAEATG